MADYGFKEGYIKPDPQRKPMSFSGPRRVPANRIVDEIKTLLETGRPCKMVIFGLYGIGKTHLVLYVKELLSDSALVKYVEMPTCHRRSHFRDLAQIMMKAVGKPNFMNYLRKCFVECKSVQEKMQELLEIDPELAEIIVKGLEEDENLLWRYLVGEKISSASMITLSAVRPQIDDLEASKVISLTSKLFNTYSGKKLIFIIDEFEKTSALAGDSMTAYVDAVRHLVDTSNHTGLIFVATADSREELRVLTKDPVQRRIGLNNFKQFLPYKDEELQDIVKDVMKIERKPKFPVKEKTNKIKTAEGMSEHTYPFTEKALEEITERIHMISENDHELIPAVRPAEVLQLTDMCISISQKDHDFIDKEIVKKISKRFIEGVSTSTI